MATTLTPAAQALLEANVRALGDLALARLMLDTRPAVRKVATAELVRRESVLAGRPCYCLSLLEDHVAGAKGCEFNADWTAR